MKRKIILVDNEVKLSGQCAEIFRALKAGPKTQVQLLRLAPKYTCRISDLRAKLWWLGYIIKCKRIRQGLFEYTLSRNLITRLHDE